MVTKIIDIRDKTCPMTTVHVRLALDKSSYGEALIIILRGEETRRNVEILLRTLGQQCDCQPLGESATSDYRITLVKS
ncbi:sulfurtransferase TusA family protein [Asaia platycodi]|uniref:sulfurtransferase TusA family protein n=1 Tax=Asaia platycodi TaxID=610243 RepID=UPI0009E02BD6